jgi:hypothetical protein
MNRAIPPIMEQKMKYLSRMKIVARFQKRMQTKAEHRRAKLIEKLEEQLGMAEALLKGQKYSKTRKAWETNDAGERVQIDRPKRIRSWFWETEEGCFVNLWYGSKMMIIQDGMSAIQIGKRSELPDGIRNIIEAVRAGELDVQIEAIAEKGLPELKLHKELQSVPKKVKLTPAAQQ